MLYNYKNIDVLAASSLAASGCVAIGDWIGFTPYELIPNQLFAYKISFTGFPAKPDAGSGIL